MSRKSPRKVFGKNICESHSKTASPAAIIHSENWFLVKILLFQPQYVLHTSRYTSKVSKTYHWLKRQVWWKKTKKQNFHPIQNCSVFVLNGKQQTKHLSVCILRTFLLFFKAGCFGGSTRVTPLGRTEHSAQTKERK